MRDHEDVRLPRKAHGRVKQSAPEVIVLRRRRPTTGASVGEGPRMVGFDRNDERKIGDG